MYTVSVDVTWHVAMDYGGVDLESVEARSVHSHLCLPGLLLVSAGASAGHHCRHLDKLLYTTEYEKPHAACMHLAVGICHKVSL